VTENKSPTDRMLELMVFGPAGLAVTLVEEFPKFVEKGRHRVEGQVHTARLIGQFAFQMGRRQLEQSLGHLGHSDDRTSANRASDDHAPVVGEPDARVPGDTGPGDRGPGDRVPGDRTAARRVPTAAHDTGVAAPDVRSAPPASGVSAPTGGGGAEEPVTPWRPSVWLGSAGPNGSGSPPSLAIPGYDSLSASQVVQRLEGLSSPELEEVRAHEAAHRQRRTILHRVEQLLTGGDGATP
jgi:hypothetical protein